MMSTHKQSSSKLLRTQFTENKYQWATVLILFIGASLRLRQFFAFRSLWLDESMLALNIINRSYAELLSPLDYSQAAPLLFLWLEKSITLLGNTSEPYLRLLPLMSGLLALFLFPIVARKYMSWRATIIALIFFAFSNSLIYYASEVKQYASDVLAALLGLLILHFILEKIVTNFHALLLLIAGSLLLAMSHPSVFVLASNALIFLFVYLRTRTKTEFLRVFIIAVGWGLTFLGLYLFSLSHIAEHPALLSFWKNAFPPSPSEPVLFFNWFGHRFRQFFIDPGGLTLIVLAIPLCILGIISLVRRSRLLSTSLILPVILVLVAATLHKYPFSTRLLLFLIPFLYFFVGEGIDWLFSIKFKPFAILIGLLASSLLMFNSLAQAVNTFLAPPMGEDIKPMIQYAADHMQDGDRVYIYYSSTHPFEYYRDHLGFDEFNDESLIWGEGHRKDWPQYLAQFEENSQNAERLWLLFSHVYAKDTVTEEAYILENLVPSKYQLLDEKHADNASVYLLQSSNGD